jgi:hypothetical protein
MRVFAFNTNFHTLNMFPSSIKEIVVLHIANDKTLIKLIRYEYSLNVNLLLTLSWSLNII